MFHCEWERHVDIYVQCRYSVVDVGSRIVNYRSARDLLARDLLARDLLARDLLANRVLLARDLLVEIYYT